MNTMEIDTKVWGRLTEEQYIYFFRKIYAGDRGLKQELIAKFFTALYEECKRKGIEAEWNPNSYIEIDKIMQSLNFNERRRSTNPPVKHPKKSHAASNDSGTINRISDTTA
jgi:hypothetical protein